MSLFDDEPETDDDLPADGWAGTPVFTAPANILLEPRLTPDLFGHEEVEKNLAKMVADNTLPHGIILTGLKGIGKATLAHRLAKFLISRPAPADMNQNALFGGDDLPPENNTENLAFPNDHKEVKLYLAGAHPDCLSVEPAYDSTGTTQKTSIDVETIRKIAPFLHKTASNGGWRVVVVDDADTMNRNAQNAILKILEEPPAKTVIILVAHRIGNLIPTIRSRTRTIHCNPLDTQTIKTLLAKTENPPSNDEIETLAQIAKGSAGKAIEMHEEEGIETLSTILGILETMPRWDWEHIHKLADNYTRKGTEKTFLQFQSILLDIFKTICQCKARGTPLPAYLARSATLKTMIDEQSLEEILKTSDSLEDHFNRANYANLDKKSVLLHAISLIAA
jgi:DNA polymerase-3 subunit delta'